MKKLLFTVMALLAVMISVPAAFARDANRDALKQGWRDQVNLVKQEARIEGLKLQAVNIIERSAVKPGTQRRLTASR